MRGKPRAVGHQKAGLAQPPPGQADSALFLAGISMCWRILCQTPASVRAEYANAYRVYDLLCRLILLGVDNTTSALLEAAPQPRHAFKPQSKRCM